MNHFIRKSVSIVLVFLLALFSTSAFAETWEAGPPIPEGAEEVVGTGVGHSMLVYGGLGPGYTPRGLFWMFDTSQEKWIELPSDPTPVHHPALVTVGNKVYLLGGFVRPDEMSWKPVNLAWMFDMETRKWSSVKALPTARGGIDGGGCRFENLCDWRSSPAGQHRLCGPHVQPSNQAAHGQRSL